MQTQFGVSGRMQSAAATLGQHCNTRKNLGRVELLLLSQKFTGSNTLLMSDAPQANLWVWKFWKDPAASGKEACQFHLDHLSTMPNSSPDWYYLIIMWTRCDTPFLQQIWNWSSKRLKDLPRFTQQVRLLLIWQVAKESVLGWAVDIIEPISIR